MSLVELEVLPLRSGVRSDAPTDLDLMIKIVPPIALSAEGARPPLNLAIVLDRSGSMAEGKKLDHARQAAIFAIEQLLPTDRVSVTIFDDQVDTIVPNTPAKDKPAIIAQLRQVVPRGSTALHGGWSAGAEQALTHLQAAGLNRVLLLSDGLANVGVLAPTAIAADVAAMRQKGVSTTTIGVGDDYNEELLEAMARAGDGNYYYVETPVQLADLFQTELRGLMATVGREASLALEPQNGVVVADILNDLDSLPDGHWRLPNLVVGMPREIIARLKVPPTTGVTQLLVVRASWLEPGRAERSHAMKLAILPGVPTREWEALPIDDKVAQRVAFLEAARLKLMASDSMARGDIAGTQGYLAACRMVTEATSDTDARTEELRQIAQLEDDLRSGSSSKLMKRARFQHFGRTRNQPDIDQT